ncbi:MAG: hypothetical protein EOP10_07400 [Proteobacteria bacterium]|nr:MAG: hypothetical protein EOP10_07400 [Pseudomonadota bacterium]
MKQFIKAGVFSCVLSMTAAFAVTAHAAATVVETQEQICSRDFNPWGKASACGCPEESTYDARIGLCLSGSMENLQAQGQVALPVSAIGGETTGVLFQSSELGEYELVLPLQLKERLEQGNFEGVDFLLEGDFLTVQGVETGDRPTVIVNSLTPITNFAQ